MLCLDCLSDLLYIQFVFNYLFIINLFARIIQNGVDAEYPVLGADVGGLM